MASDIQLSVDLEPGDVTAAASRLQSQIESIFNSATRQGTDTQFQRLQMSMDKVYVRASDIMSRMNTLNSINIRTEQYERLQTKIAEVTKQMDLCNTRSDELRKEMTAVKDVEVPTEKYKRLQNEIENLNTRIKNATELQQALASDKMGKWQLKEYANRGKEIDGLKNELASLKQQEQELIATDQAFAKGPGYERFNGLREELLKERETYTELLDVRQNYVQQSQELEQAGISSTPDKQTQEYANLTQQLGQVNNQMRIYVAQAEQAGYYAPPITGWSLAKTAIMGVVNGVKLAVAGVKNLGSAFLKLNISMLKRAANAAKTLAKNLAKAATAKLSGAFKSLGSSILHVGKSSKSAQPDMKKLFTTILKYGFGIRSFYFLFRKLRSALADGFKNLAGYSEPFNQTISNLISSLNYLKNSFAAAFAPLVSVVAPILSQFIDRMASAVNMVGQFFAALTGKKTFVQAKKLYTSYTKATDKSTDKTQKKVEKLQKTILGFDDVNILKGPDNDNDTPSASDYDPSTDPKNMFDTVKIGDGINDWVKKFKEMWKNADFTDLGRIVGEKLRDALNRIPWDEIKAVLRKIGKSIATFLNGFLEVPGLFDAIGRTLAQALNSAFEFLESFISNFHWDSLGRAIKEGILGFLNNIDWELIYKTFREFGTGIGTTLETALDNPEIWTAILGTFAKQINAMVYGLDAFLKAVNWGSLAANIATGLNNAIETLDWNAIGQTLIDLINGAFDLWYNFVTTFDFKKFGTHIGETLSTVLRGVNWSEGGASVAATIQGLLEALSGFIGATDWAALGSAIIQFISGFFNEFDWSTVSEFLTNCIVGLWNFFIGAIQEVDWDEVADKIPSAIHEFLSGFDWKKIAETFGTLLGAAFKAIIKIGSVLWNLLKDVGKDIIEGGYQGIKDKIKSVGTWIKDNIFTPFIKGFKSAFGIGSPSKEMKTQGQYISQGMLDGIKDKLSDVGSWLKTNVFDKVKNGLSTAFGIVGGVANNLKEIGSSVISGIKDGTTLNESTLTNALQTLTSNMESTLKSGDWFSVGDNILTGINNGIQSGWSWLSTTVGNLAGSLFTTACNVLGIQSPSRLFRDKVGKMIPAGLAIGINSESDTALDAVDDLSNQMLNNTLKDIKIPPIAMGGIIPPNIGKSTQQDTINTLNDVLEMLQYNQDAMVTREDLAEILTDVLPDMLRRYVSFVIGDEQLARHANAGNNKLNRRFKPVTT